MPFNTEIILNTKLKIRTYIMQITEKTNSVRDIQDHIISHTTPSVQHRPMKLKQ